MAYTIVKETFEKYREIGYFREYEAASEELKWFFDNYKIKFGEIIGTYENGFFTFVDRVSGEAERYRIKFGEIIGTYENGFFTFVDRVSGEAERYRIEFLDD